MPGEIADWATHNLQDRCRRSAEVLFETRQIGHQMRVAAIDPRTGTEVVVFGPVAAGSKGLQAMAARKLVLRLQRLGRFEWHED